MFVFSINNQEKEVSIVTVSNCNGSVCVNSPAYSYEVDLLFNHIEFFKTHCDEENNPFSWRKIVKVYNEKCYESYLRFKN